MLRCAQAEARRQGCFRLQLTSEKRRPAAHRLYDRPGCAKSHEGFQIGLPPNKGLFFPVRSTVAR